MEKETRISLIDEANEPHDIRLASDRTIVKRHGSRLGVAVLDGWAAAPTAISVDKIEGWQTVVTDGDTGETYSGPVTHVSQYGFLLQEE